MESPLKALNSTVYGPDGKQEPGNEEQVIADGPLFGGLPSQRG